MVLFKYLIVKYQQGQSCFVGVSLTRMNCYGLFLRFPSYMFKTRYNPERRIAQSILICLNKYLN